MDIQINVFGQLLQNVHWKVNFVEGSQEFVRFKFNLSSEWNGLSIFAQFIQSGVAYNQYLDSENRCYLPTEIQAGTCTMLLYGSDNDVIATTNYITLTIDENILISDAQSTEISQSLYQQLVTRVNALGSVSGQNVLDLVDTDRELQAQINLKAAHADLLAEIQRAKSAENANTNALALKASQADVDELELRLDELSNNEVIAEEIQEAVQSELLTYLTSGQLASMTIADGSLEREKVDEDFEETLEKADTAMQPSVYDPQGRQADVFSYAQAKADTVQNNLNATNAEIRAAYALTDTLTYQNLGDTIKGAVTVARNYAQALLSDYKAFTVTIVDSLPNAGDAQTFYLVPKESGNGYDKYWYIYDDDGNGMWDVFGGSSTVVVDTLPTVGEVDIDYILKTSSGCLYYKYIDGLWKIVAGSIAYVASSLPSVANGNSFTDYYIVSDNGSYIHYRFINGAYQVIGGDGYTKDEIDAIITGIEEDVSENASDIASTNTNLNALSRTVDSLASDVAGIDTEGFTYYHTIEKDEDTGNYVLTLYQVKGEEEEIASQTVLPATGGEGGGSTTTTTITLERITASPLVITTTDSAIIEVNFSSVDGDGETVDATYTWKSNGTVILSGTMAQGRNAFDLSQFVSVGTQKFSLTVVDEAGTTVLKTWTVQMVDVRIESSFNDRYTTPIGRSVSFPYTPYGAISKTIHFKLDGVDSTVTTTSSGTLQSYTVPAQEHGAHMLEVWATATINNVQVETAHIYKDIIWYDAEPDENGDYQDAVIGCIYRNDYYGTVTARQYDTTAIIYNVFDPTTNYPVVKRYLDGNLVSTDTLTSSRAVWNFQSGDVGEHTLEIVVRDTTVTIDVTVEELGIDVSPVTGGLEIDFNPTGITNSSADRIWSNENYHMSVSENFDWANGGYKTDENGDTYFLVKAGTRASFDYYMFPASLDNNPATLGAEMKIVFKTENVQDANAVWFSNVESTTTTVGGTTQTTNLGIQMGVHNGWLKTNSASDTDVSVGEGESAQSVAATNTYLYMPYCEEEIIEMDINIDAISREDSSAQAFCMAYEDGVPSKAFVYTASDRFYQYSQKPIVIGSDYCDVRVYRMKLYSTALTTENIMRNFIADSRDSNTMLARYDRNSVYYNRETGEYTPYSGEGVLDPERLAAVIPNVKVLMLDTDHFTTSKKVFVKSKLRCIHASGGDLYEGDPYYDNWYFENGYHSGQGTTSDNYGNAGRNVDFLFNCDGTHKPSDKVDAEAGYVSKVTLGYNTENATTESVADWMGADGKVALTRTSVPNNFFNLKVNIASSENVNNALLQKRYNDYLPYISPAKQRDARVKNDMEFVPAVLFLRENNPDVTTHNEFNDTEWHFYALGNIGDSKKTDYTRAYDPDDMNEFTIEISDNTKNNATFQTGVYLDENDERVVEAVGDTGVHSYVYPITAQEWTSANNKNYQLYSEGFDGDHSFEPRYACCGDYRDGKIVNDTHNGADPAQVAKNNDVWRAFYRWVITSTDQQFVDELDQWCVRSAVEFFYAFTHIYTMMDNRAKNTFWHFAKTGTFREVSRPVGELIHTYCELIDGEYVPTEDTSIDADKTYYTQYAFDLWDYDNDTALGINNNGELIFPYGKEDTDYNIEDNPSSGYVYNGATSVFWCRLRDLLQSEIRTTFNTTVAAECFSATHLVNQFDAYQECYPEEIWRLDIERKYIRTFTGESVDNSIPKHDTQYLRDMMQGRKKYQRRQWVRDQEIYFGTKNLMNTVVGDNNRITFRCFTPTGDDVAVEPDYTLKITPYSDMYLSVTFGNGGTEQVRAKGGTEYTVECPLTTMDDTQVIIYGANRIQALSDLSACYIAANNFSMATKLRKLVLGNTTDGYNNSRLVSLTLGSNELLEELDIRNCGSLTGAIDLSQCSNLLKLYAEGTALTGVTFATNGKVQIAHLPSSINTLIMRNLNDLTDFDADLGFIETLTLQGGTLDSLEIIGDCIDTLRTLYLYDINWTVSDTTLLNAMNSLFYSIVTGSVYVSGPIRNQELLQYAAKWPDAEITYDPNQLVTQHLVTYVNADADHTVLYQLYVDQGSTPPDIFANGMLTAMPTLDPDEQYSYSFGEFEDDEYVTGSGWDGLTEVVRAPRTVTAVYVKTTRTYTVNWYSRQGLLLETATAQYGEEAVYSGSLPTNTSQEGSLVFNVFAGWDKSTGFVRNNIDVYAIWNSDELPSPGAVELKDMSAAQVYGIAKRREADSHWTEKDYIDIEVGKDFNFSNVQSRVLAEDLYFNGTTAVRFDGHDTSHPVIKLFDADAPDFTIAIDYEFTSTDVNGTLVSAFDENGSEGFRLRYNTAPNIQWGDVNASVGYGMERGIVVLKHRKGSNSLYVASNNPGNGVYNDALIASELTRSRATQNDTVLTLGGVPVGTLVNDYFATGWIHWCKIWYADLGNTAVKQLACWPHETWRMEYYGSERYRLADNSGAKCGASFIANAPLSLRHNMNTTNTNAGGWNASKMRTFVNDMCFNALPFEWQAIISTVRIPASAGSRSNEIINSEDKLYLPAYAEVSAQSAEPYISEGRQIPWFVDNPSRVKFCGIIIPEGSRTFTSQTDPTLVSSNDIQEGDIWINQSNSSNGFIYLSPETAAKHSFVGGRLSSATDNRSASTGGLWVCACYWWERSPNVSDDANFMDVYTYGYPGDSSGATATFGVVLGFSI